MKIFLIIALMIFLYLRKTINKLWENTRINYLLDLYENYRNATSYESKLEAFGQIAKNRPLSDDLLSGTFYVHSSPSYGDFEDEEKIKDTCLKLYEVFDENRYYAKKYLNPKYFIKDLFFLPGAILNYLFNREFNKVPSFLVSCLTWIATILISAYAAELRVLINAIIKKFI